MHSDTVTVGLLAFLAATVGCGGAVDGPQPRQDADGGTSGTPDIGTSGTPDNGTSGTPDNGTSGTPDIGAATVVLTSPVDGDAFPEGSSVTVAADASDPDGIETVRFLLEDGQTSAVVYSGSMPPYEGSVGPLAQGSYAVWARVLDRAGNTTNGGRIAFSIEDASHNPGPYDGSIIAGDQKNEAIYIMDPAKKDLDTGILWSLTASSKIAGVADGDTIVPGGTDIKWVKGGTHVLIVGRTIALIRLADTTAVWYGRSGGGNVHSGELLPDGNIVTAHSDGNCLKLFATNKGNNVSPVEFPFGGAHGVVWDNKRKLLWAIGGAKLWSFEYRGDGNVPTIAVHKKHEIEASGHDLYPVPGRDQLYFTSKHVWIFDIATETASIFMDLGGIKAISQNGRDGEIIYTRGEGNNASALGIRKWQTPHIRSRDGHTRTFEGAGFYKARWFVPCPFSYP